MSTKLLIDDLLVPPEVTRGYLKNYDENFLQEIEKLYQKIEKEELAKCVNNVSLSPAPCVVVVGGHGVGKTHLVDRITKERPLGYVVCDADAIMTRLPKFQEGLKEVMISAHGLYDASQNPEDHMRNSIENYTNFYLPAARYIADRLLAKCVNEGIPVIFETTGKSKHIGNLMDNITKAGALIETHLCQAPLSIKLKALDARFLADHDIALDKTKITDEHEALLRNMAVIAQKSTGDFTIHWRQHVNKPLASAVVATGADYVVDKIAREAFDAYFMDHGHTIEQLMGSRVPANENKFQANLSSQFVAA